VEPGRISAQVSGSRSKPYDVVVRVRPFTDQEWGAALGMIGASAAHLAALLDGDMLPGLVEDLEARGVQLLPAAGEVVPACSCPDWANPCKHAAAVCYLMASRLDADPFELLALRGRTREDVLAALRQLRSGTGSDPFAPAHRRLEPDSGIGLPPSAGAPPAAAIPLPPPPPARPGIPPAIALEPPPGAAVDRADLAALARDAAGRAWGLLVGESPDAGLRLDPESDLARLAANVIGVGPFEGLARRAGIPVADLSRLALAWRAGGVGGVDVLTRRWSPTPAEFSPGLAALQRAAGGRVSRSKNWLTAGDLQLRLGVDGLWYLLERRRRGWELQRPPAEEPADILFPTRSPTNPSR